MKITVIIPTRNRAATLRQSLNTCFSQDEDDFEILVSDNDSSDDTESVVRAVDDPRVRYVRTSARLSMSGNFEFALRQVSAGAVGFIGDDDGLMPGAIRRVRAFMADSGARAVTSTFASYRWPCAPESIRNTGTLQWCGRDELRDSIKFARRTLSGTGGYYVHDLPSLYYGFADIRLTRPTASGRFFNSITPDAYSAFAIAAQTSIYGYLGAPLFVVGASGRSNGVSHFVDDASVGEKRSFASENNLPFHRLFRQSRSLAGYTAEAFMQVVDAYPEWGVRVELKPMDLLYNMARESRAGDPEGIRTAALHYALEIGLDRERVLRAFSPSSIALQKARRTFTRLARRLAVPRFVKTKRFSAMDRMGITNVEDASKFFARILIGDA